MDPVSDIPIEFDCRSCAACCCDASDGRVLISSDDLVRWRREARPDILGGLVEGHFGMQGFGAKPDGRCEHLGIDDRPLDCAIYPTRGASCRLVEAGDPQCLSYRRAQGL